MQEHQGDIRVRRIIRPEGYLIGHVAPIEECSRIPGLEKVGILDEFGVII